MDNFLMGALKLALAGLLMIWIIIVAILIFIFLKAVVENAKNQLLKKSNRGKSDS